MTTRGEITAEVQVSGPCGGDVRTLVLPVEAPYNLSVNGIEVSQAIQHYRSNEHLNLPAQQGPDNSLQLVTNKTAVVRVYLRSGGDPGFAGGNLADVTGTLRVERRNMGLWVPIGTLTPINGPVTARESYTNHDQERSNPNNSLNFVVPAAWMNGLLRFVADVDAPNACGDQRDSDSVDVLVDLTQTLNAAFITVGYSGPNNTGTANITLAAPTLANCIAETSWAMAAFPVSGAPNVRVAGTFTTNLPLNDMRTAPGACSPNWGPTLAAIATAIAADTGAGTTQWVYYGLIAGGIPVNVPGCAAGGVTGGLAGSPQTYAHEIGHIMGLPHAPCGNVGVPNPNYPVYDPYDLPADGPGTTVFNMASIGEYGIDMRSGVPVIRSPRTNEDFMSYCGPAWMSKFTHGFLVNRPELSPVVTPSGDAMDVPVDTAGPFPDFGIDIFEIRDRIYLLGLLDEDESLTVERVSRMPARNIVTDGLRTDMVFELVGETGEVVSSGPLYSFHQEGGCGCSGHGGGHGHGDGHEGPQLIAAMIDDVEPGLALRIRKRQDKEALWTKERPDEPGKVELSDVEIKETTLSLRWQSNIKEADHWVRWSADKGESWGVLAIGLEGDAAEIDISHLPSGDLMFQMMAQDGFGASKSEPAEAIFEGAPPHVAILSPSTDVVPTGADFVVLRGAAMDGETPIDDKAYVWEIDGTEIGERGPEVMIPRPKSGAHELVLRVASEFGEGVARHQFTVSEQ
jgi:hypothetical protein